MQYRYPGHRIIPGFLRKELEKSNRFDPPPHIKGLARYASPIVSLGNQTGEGWFLTGEMIELIEGGAPNIVCTQPFACLPNHVVGKGVIKELRRKYPQSNIVAIDYDPGASEVNQVNRIKLMLATAQKNLEDELKKRKTLRNTVPCQVTVSCQEHCSLTEESRRTKILRLSSNNSMHFITVISCTHRSPEDYFLSSRILLRRFITSFSPVPKYLCKVLYSS